VRAEITLTFGLHRRAAFDGNAGFDLGCRADVTRCLDLRRGVHLSRLVDPDTLLGLRSCGLDPATSLQGIFHQLSIFGGGQKTHDVPYKIVSGPGKVAVLLPILAVREDATTIQ